MWFLLDNAPNFGLASPCFKHTPFDIVLFYRSSSKYSGGGTIRRPCPDAKSELKRKTFRVFKEQA